MDELKGILKVINLSEKLKYELRHSFLSNGRQESVAEHTWRVSLMAMLIEKYLSKPVDTEKLLKMIIIHDLVEAEAGDIPAFDTMNNEEVKRLKHENELMAIERIRDMLGTALGPDVYDLWMEFEGKESYEAKVANGLDKLEAQVQHNEAELSTWIDIEYDMCYMLDKHVDFEPSLMELKELILQQAEEKLNNGGIDVEAIKRRC
ncbi:HD domain-containing protein [Clostridium manihotivorum]|uniref:HAD family hydrolase n=1 Tax=Clostridium manihotivorum TaxID=2320868 RepID=A0A3R5QVV4_9CLOT|nr:HD domain-containing protein [Clostridium manihotivorum]QAA33831.1 HAD family hydrolase [Clostridium manihotivorum]